MIHARVKSTFKKSKFLIFSLFSTEWLTYTKSNNNYCGIFSSVCHTKTDGDKLVLSPFATHIQLCIDSGCNQISLFKNLFHVSSDESTTVRCKKVFKN